MYIRVQHRNEWLKLIAFRCIGMLARKEKKNCTLDLSRKICDWHFQPTKCTIKVTTSWQIKKKWLNLKFSIKKNNRLLSLVCENCQSINFSNHCHHFDDWFSSTKQNSVTKVISNRHRTSYKFDICYAQSTLCKKLAMCYSEAAPQKYDTRIWTH